MIVDGEKIKGRPSRRGVSRNGESYIDEAGNECRPSRRGVSRNANASARGDANEVAHPVGA